MAVMHNDLKGIRLKRSALRFRGDDGWYIYLLCDRFTYFAIYPL